MFVSHYNNTVLNVNWCMHFLATSSPFSLSKHVVVFSANSSSCFASSFAGLVNFWSNNIVDSTDLKSTSLHCTDAFRTVKLSVKY